MFPPAHHRHACVCVKVSLCICFPPWVRKRPGYQIRSAGNLWYTERAGNADRDSVYISQKEKQQKSKQNRPLFLFLSLSLFFLHVPDLNLRLCFAYTSPQTLQRRPSGPLRHSGVSVRPHFEHATVSSSSAFLTCHCRRYVCLPRGEKKRGGAGEGGSYRDGKSSKLPRRHTWTRLEGPPATADLSLLCEE